MLLENELSKRCLLALKRQVIVTVHVYLGLGFFSTVEIFLLADSFRTQPPTGSRLLDTFNTEKLFGFMILQYQVYFVKCSLLQKIDHFHNVANPY